MYVTGVYNLYQYSIAVLQTFDYSNCESVTLDNQLTLVLVSHARAEEDC